MPHRVAEKVRKWAREFREPTEEQLPDYQGIYAFIFYLASRLYIQYVPTLGATHPDFGTRLSNWLDCAPKEADQKTLFHAVPSFFFVGRKEMESLYMTAFNGPVARWLLDELEIGFDAPNAQQVIRQGLCETWFCGITDSLDIGLFHRINNITGASIRPQLMSYLNISGNAKQTATEIINFMRSQSPPLRRIVLLEDFVGTGQQNYDIVKFMAELPTAPPVLFCPLMICPVGSNAAYALASNHTNLTYTPALELSDDIFLWRTARANEPPSFGKLRDVVVRLYPLVEGSNSSNLYGPFGFNNGDEERGALIVLYSNCPDNTLPIIHHNSDGPWQALFPRNSRV